MRCDLCKTEGPTHTMEIRPPRGADPEKVEELCRVCLHEFVTLRATYPKWDNYKTIRRLRKVKYGNRTTTGRKAVWA